MEILEEKLKYKSKGSILDILWKWIKNLVVLPSKNKDISGSCTASLNYLLPLIYNRSSSMLVLFFVNTCLYDFKAIEIIVCTLQESLFVCFFEDIVKNILLRINKKR